VWRRFHAKPFDITLFFSFKSYSFAFVHTPFGDWFCLSTYVLPPLPRPLLFFPYPLTVVFVFFSEYLVFLLDYGRQQLLYKSALCRAYYNYLAV